MSILTPSYAPDFDSFRLLHRSVLECTPPDVEHVVIVPDADLALFESLASPRLRLVGLGSVMPRSFVGTPWLARAAIRWSRVPRGARIAAINRASPWPPVRSWILQQIVKLEVASRSDADVLLLIDSDSQLIAPVDQGTFLVDGAVPLFRADAAITAEMRRHVAWHRAARRLLGLPDDGPPPYDDPIAGMVAWEPDLVRAMLDRVGTVSGRDWPSTIAREWAFSEYVLYGEYHRELAASERPATNRDRSISWWDPVPLTESDAARLRATTRPGDLVLHIQSTSGTPLQLRERLGRELRERH